MKLLNLTIALFFIGFVTFAQPIQWRGPKRDGKFPETGLLQKWPDGGPQLLLKVEGIGKGFSSVVATDQYIFATGMIDTLDYLSCITLDGKIKWKVPYGRSWVKSFPETRSTPTIENNRIYLASGMGQVSCLDAVSGKLLWTVDAQKDYKGESHNWGIAESVAISDKAIFYVTGGEETSVVALSKSDGKLLWKTRSLGGPRAYASSVIIEKAGLRMLLAQTANDLMAINIENGEIIWSYNLVQYHAGQMGKGANTNTPLFYNDEIFITSGYDHPALLLSLAADGRSVSLKWTNPDFDSHMGGAVKIGNYVYGSNWINNGKGNWICVDWNTGKTMYDTNWFNKGSIISADGLLYCYEEKTGNIALVKPNPEKFEVISSFKIEKGTGPHWAHPAIYDGKLLIRHGECLMIYDLKK